MQNIKRKPPGFWKRDYSVLEEFTESIYKYKGFKKIDKPIKAAIDKYPNLNEIRNRYNESYGEDDHSTIKKIDIMKRLEDILKEVGLNKIKEVGLNKNSRKYSDPWENDEIKIIREYGGEISDSQIIKDHLPHIPSVSWISKKRKELGIPPYRYNPNKETIEYNGEIYTLYDDYFARSMGKGTFEYLHIKVYEDYYNITVKDDEIVHHIDGDKTFNEIENLILLDNDSEHKSLHQQLCKLAYEFLDEGIIGFNENTGEYFLKEF